MLDKYNYYYQAEFIPEDIASEILATANTGEWTKNRHHQHFYHQQHGYSYAVNAKNPERPDDYVGTIPPWLNILSLDIREALIEIDLHSALDEYQPFNQVSLYNVPRGVGFPIQPVKKTYEPLVAIISLGSDINIMFEDLATGETGALRVYKNSLLVLYDEIVRNTKFGLAEVYADKVLNRIGQIDLVDRDTYVQMMFRNLSDV